MLLASDGIAIGEKWTTVLPSKIDGDFFYSVHCWWPEVPDVYRRLISQKVSVSRNLSQKVIPSDIIKPEGHKNFYFWSYYHQEICPKGKTIYFRCEFF